MKSIGLVALIGAVGLYLHTSHAFRYVVLPILRSSIDGDLQVTRGSISILGAFRLEDVQYTNTSGSDVFRAISVSGSADVLSVAGWLVGKSVPLIEDLDLDQSEFFIYRGSNDETSANGGTGAVRESEAQGETNFSKALFASNPRSRLRTAWRLQCV